MNLQEIIMADSTAILLMVVLLINRFIVRRHKETEDRFFSSMVFIGLAAAALELIVFLLDGKPGVFAKILNVGFNHILYACTTTISIVWLWYVDSNLNQDTRRIRTVFLPFVILWGIFMLALIPNIWLGYLFSFGGNNGNEYIRQPAGYAYYGFLFVCFAASIVVYIRYKIVHGESKFFPIWMFLIPVILCCIVQGIWYGIAMAWLGCAIGLTAIYLNIQSRFAFIDGLTGLYNRAFIEHKLIVARKNKKYVFGGIMLDIDDFKQINDTFGHSTGDEALRQVAKILLNASDNKTLIFRFAGDEFVLLVKVPQTEKDELLPKMLELEKAIRSGAEEFNKNKKNKYDLVFSIGHTIFDNSLPDDEFFHQMDLEMYKEKKLHHN